LTRGSRAAAYLIQFSSPARPYSAQIAGHYQQHMPDRPRGRPEAALLHDNLMGMALTWVRIVSTSCLRFWHFRFQNPNALARHFTLRSSTAGRLKKRGRALPNLVVFIGELQTDSSPAIFVAVRVGNVGIRELENHPSLAPSS
jgi:hypothetical protein